MEKRTNDLIKKLSRIESRDEIDLEVLNAYQELQDSLVQRGYVIEDESGSFRGGQRILGRDLSDYEYYNELNFIKNGLEDKWVAMMDDYDNYKEIEDRITDITVKFF